MFDTSNLHSQELGQLYHDVILDHSKSPRCKRRPHECRLCQEGKNPLCGDQVTVFVTLSSHAENHSLLPKLSVFFEGSGCSISQASTSMMCSLIQNVTANEARKWIQQSEEIYSGKKEVSENDFEEDIEALAGVSRFPVRVKCAALPWKTLELLLDENFDAQGHLKTPAPSGEVLKSCPLTRKLKVVSTE